MPDQCSYILMYLTIVILYYDIHVHSVQISTHAIVIYIASPELVAGPTSMHFI